MNEKMLQAQIEAGEDSRNRFLDVLSAEQLAIELAAMANTVGGTVYMGVCEDGSLPGLARQDVPSINKLISKVAADYLDRPLRILTTNIAIGNNHVVIAVQVQASSVFYQDCMGRCWVKNGAGLRVLRSEELTQRQEEVQQTEPQKASDCASPCSVPEGEQAKAEAEEQSFFLQDAEQECEVADEEQGQEECASTEGRQEEELGAIESQQANSEPCAEEPTQTSEESIEDIIREKTSIGILTLAKQKPGITTQEMGEVLGVCKRTVLKRIALLKQHGLLARKGSTKTGTWDVLGIANDYVAQSQEGMA